MVQDRQLLHLAVVAAAVTLPSLVALVAILLILGPHFGVHQATSINYNARLGQQSASSLDESQGAKKPPTVKPQQPSKPRNGH